ncbi:ribosome biogenesis protein BRX1 homolog [Macrobrachium nipponense]|uniref:ribosome biogenesis protein BRX1 homolog n=1 Tax=Macrobrachium nipponense TaxID=159736 RepID=UPI0030C80359
MAKKRKANAVEEETETKPKLPPLVRDSDAPPPKKKKWINRQRVLIFGSRGLSFRERHLMQDLRAVMPHSKGESKKEKKDDIKIINEMCEMKNCSKCIYFENRKKRDLYMWVSNVPQGPSVKFLVLNVHTMLELKLTGNCLKGSRPLLSFDIGFDEPHWQVIKELLVQVFSTPNHHPKSQPFHDHVMSFSILDNKIWVRNYEVLAMDGKLAEIGPRFVLDPIKIFEDSFGGATLWENKDFVNPNTYRRNLRSQDSVKYLNKLNQLEIQKVRPVHDHIGDPTNEIFMTKPPEEAEGEEKQLFVRKRK